MCFRSLSCFFCALVVYQVTAARTLDALLLRPRYVFGQCRFCSGEVLESDWGSPARCFFVAPLMFRPGGFCLYLFLPPYSAEFCLCRLLRAGRKGSLRSSSGVPVEAQPIVCLVGSFCTFVLRQPCFVWAHRLLGV